MRRLVQFVALTGLALAGCRTPAPVAMRPPPAGSPPPLELPIGQAAPFAVELASLPAVEVTQVPAEELVPSPRGVRPITEAVCQREAAARSSLAALTPPDAVANCPGWREYLVAIDRNRATAKALEQFYQLADAEGRAAIVRASLPILDELRAGVKEAKAKGVQVPLESADLDRQRASLLALLGQAELGANLLDVDLKRRVGVPGRVVERLRPVGPFPPVSTLPLDRESLIQVALTTRPDLQLLRAASLGLSPETLPRVRKLLDTSEFTPPSFVGPGSHLARRLLTRRVDESINQAEIAAEVTQRQAQLMELVAQRERQAADEVRAAILGVEAQVIQVALARWRVEQFQTQLANGPDAGPLARLALQLEAARAEADLVVAVATFQQNRVKLLAAQGLLAAP